MARPLKTTLLLFVLCAAALLGFGCSRQIMDGDGMVRSYEQITQEEAARLMEAEKDYILLDVRTREEYAEAHIPGAVCVPNEEIGTEPPPELPDKDQLILIYCRSGRRSKEAAQKLFDMGYTRIREFGGIITWPGETVSDISDAVRPVLMLDGAEEGEADGVRLLVTGYADGKISVRLTNTTEEEKYCGMEFSLSVKKNGAWQELPWPEDMSWIALAQVIPARGETEAVCDASALGALDSGEYLLEKAGVQAEFRLVWSE
ncbi:MAG: rhodanese-like domain-containing protein [Oscillospiraceae bacterium]|nr:rhodanese-like domain-containing protein [Oscillospiraceae bacterium]